LAMTFHACLSESVTIPANKSMVAFVHVEMYNVSIPVSLLMEAACKKTGLITDRALLQPSDDNDRTACSMVIHNVGGLD